MLETVQTPYVRRYFAQVSDCLFPDEGWTKNGPHLSAACRLNFCQESGGYCGLSRNKHSAPPKLSKLEILSGLSSIIRYAGLGILFIVGISLAECILSPMLTREFSWHSETPKRMVVPVNTILYLNLLLLSHAKTALEPATNNYAPCMGFSSHSLKSARPLLCITGLAPYPLQGSHASIYNAHKQCIRTHHDSQPCT